MSQKTRITHVKIKGGKPYLGTRESGSNEYSDNPDRVMTWLCDGWRSRYNQCRSTRSKYGPDHTLAPIGGTVTDIKDSEARRQCPWLAAIPQLILQSPSRIESVEWYSSVKRRKTARKRHRNPGRMPRFRSRKHDPQYFVCWHKNGANANYRQVNRNHGIVTITGQNPVGHRDEGIRWRIEIHIRVSQPIRDYTSIRVNWTGHTLVFTNPPQPLDAPVTGRAVGLDRGVTHQLATSDGEFLDMPKNKLKAIDREIRRRQRVMARKARLAGYASQRDYRRHGASRQYAKQREAVTRLHRQAHRIRMDWAQKTTTQLIRDYDFIVLETLNLQGMSRRCKPKPDLEHPGHWLHNGQSRKRGLNRGMRQAGLGMLNTILDYKANLIPGKTVQTINPAYTSRTCIACGHTAKENRESQAVFHCQACGYQANADLNAAVNILNRGITIAAGDLTEQSMDYALRAIDHARRGAATCGPHATVCPRNLGIQASA